MAGVPSIDARAFREWPQRLRAAGYEVEVKEHDAVFAVGVVRKGGREVELALPTHTSGTAAVFMNGRNARRRDRDFVLAIVEALRTPLGVTDEPSSEGG